MSSAEKPLVASPMEQEKERTRDIVGGIVGHLEHVQTRVELLHYLEEQRRMIGIELDVDRGLEKLSREARAEHMASR
jgi:hypothetical protein